MSQAGRGITGLEARPVVDFVDLEADPLVDRRHDVKAVLDGAELDRLIDRAPDDWQVVTADASTAHPYHTVYFDTPDLRLFRDHRQGRLRRFKVRTRRYGDGTTILEVKLKGPKRLTQKVRRIHGEHGSITPNDIMWMSESLERMIGHAAPELLEPAAWTRYERTILRAPDGTERLTVDRSLAAGCGAEPTSIASADAIIVELKSLAPRSVLLPALHAIGARPLRLSKYAVAVHHLHDAHANRWLPALRRLDLGPTPETVPSSE